MFLNALSPISSSPARFGALYLEPRITEPKTSPRQVWFAPYIVDLQGPMTGMQLPFFRGWAKVWLSWKKMTLCC